MNTVVEYINKAHPAEAVAALNETQGIQIDEARWDLFKKLVNEAVQVDSDIEIIIRYQEFKYDNVDEKFFDVCGREGGDTLALDFMEWGDWKGQPVINETGEEMTPDNIAAQLYYEMTWHGFPEQTEMRRDRLMDSVEEISRLIDKEE